MEIGKAKGPSRLKSEEYVCFYLSGRVLFTTTLKIEKTEVINPSN